MAEADGGASSTMPHKHNPCARLARAPARGTCARTRPSSSRAPCRSTSARPAPGTRSGTRSRRRSRDRRRGRGDPRLARRARGGRRAHAREHDATTCPRSGAARRSSGRLPRRGRGVRRPRPRALPRMSGTVVLCGSLGSTSAMWDPQLPALQDAARAVEHPGHGGAPVPDVRSIAISPRACSTMRERLLVRRLSLGGAVGMRLAATRRIASTSSCSPAPARSASPRRGRARAAIVRSTASARRRRVLARWFTPAFGESPVPRVPRTPPIPRAMRAAARRSRAGRPRRARRNRGADARDRRREDDPSTPPPVVEARRRHSGRALRGDRERRAPRERRTAGEFNRLLEEHL